MILAAALAATAATAQAGGVGVRAGTTGVGVDLGGDVAPTLGWRLGVSGMNVNTHLDTNDVRYDAKAKVLTGSLLLDWSPLGPFRISGGFMPNNNKIDLNGQPNSGNLTCGPAATPAQCAQAQSDVAAEQTRLEDSLKKFKYFPVGSLGITIGF